MSVKSKHSTSKKEKTKKKEKKKNVEDSDEEIESSEEELDLTKECHPIGHYINNRAEMINQMFSVIKGNKLKAMLPPVLKDYDLEQLKLQCLDQLLGMSEKRIMCILEGETLDVSSESEVLESDGCDSDGKNNSSSGLSSHHSDESLGNACDNTNGSKSVKRKAEFSSEGKDKKMAKANDETTASEQGKTLLEILELEMRARAIRALLKQSGSEIGTEQESNENQNHETNFNGLKEASDEVVDLTGCEDEDISSNIKNAKVKRVDENEVFKSEKDIIKMSEGSHLPEKIESSKKNFAELQFRNKLFKKKIYRTRQQRMENEEEEKNNVTDEQNEEENLKMNFFNNEVLASEPSGVKAVKNAAADDPEEGEINSSEDEFQVKRKQVSQEEKPEALSSSDCQTVPCEKNSNECAEIAVEKHERTDATDALPGDAINDDILEIEDTHNELSDSVSAGHSLDESKSVTVEKNDDHVECSDAPDFMKNEAVNNTSIEETSWRDRWLQNDGVQKLVKSSKIYAKVKKRIAEKSQKAKDVLIGPETCSGNNKMADPVEIIEGSIDEYERLLNKMPGQKNQ